MWLNKESDYWRAVTSVRKFTEVSKIVNYIVTGHEPDVPIRK